MALGFEQVEQPPELLPNKLPTFLSDGLAEFLYAGGCLAYPHHVPPLKGVVKLELRVYQFSLCSHGNDV
jgi:hypothetical protein